MNDGSFTIHIDEAVKLLKECSLFKSNYWELGRHRKVGIMRIVSLESYDKYFSEVLNCFDFDILLQDDSFFQFEKTLGTKDQKLRYVFMQNRRSKKISFEEYCNDNVIDIEIHDAELDEYREFYEDDESITELNDFPFYIRYDASEKGYNPNIHSYSHLHIGLVQECRIPLDKVLTPNAFVCFVIKHVYNDIWNDLLNKNKDKYLSYKHLCQDLKEKYWQDDEKKDLYLT